MQTQRQNLQANRLTAKLIAKNLDDFDIGIAITLQGLVKQIQQKRSISNRAARKVATEFIGELK